MSLPKYPEYKDSGVEWLGSVPSHWKVDRLKAAVQSCKNGIWGDEPKGDESDIPCVRVADFDRIRLVVNEDVPTLRSVTDKERIGRLLKKGDLLLEKSGGGDLKPVGQVVLYQSENAAVCSNFVARLQLKEHLVSGFWNYAFAATYAAGLNTRCTNQTSGIQNLDQERYFNETAIFPPVAEQAAIAEFLDRETAKIDALIAEQEKLIVLLAEKRQATISHAVTRGLNPAAPMKDSGVEWLGQVPAHWEVMTFQRCVYVQEGQVDPESDEYSSMVLIAPNHVESASGRLLYVETAQEQAAQSGKYLCRGGDVIYSKIRPGLRKACIAPSDCLCSADMYPLRGNENLSNTFLLWFILSEQFSALAVLESERVAMPKINRESLKAVWLPIPPINEQIAIGNFLNSEATRLDALGEEAQQAIELLKERRAALIAAVVTGQIDVRGLVDAPQEAA
ncbi:restriction endonuclease subunit S [Crenobacter intestini]|uniref:Restriction endonuclease subunit S n=1 Tax=Crenobacter intestini TaxID=2563443 RepID=A0A4T0V214_9NEIS|nr:restriction endonuclease subunit S [Crenobacter intestini]TIC85196.1 restriction endonuclease subunit S [Crenobacter intestini]